jgi:hypothetical protein
MLPLRRRIGRLGRFLVLCLGAAACGLAVAERAPAQADAKLPDPKLYALLVFDTDSTLKPFLDGNRARLEQVLDQTFKTRPNNFEKKVLAADAVTRRGVLEYYQKELAGKVKSEDTLLFYYAGHGATIGERGHCLTMFHDGAGPYLARKELLDAMKDLKARHVVVLTDCCSADIRGVFGKEERLPEASWPVIDCLLFQHRGVTDVNACQQNAFSWFSNTGDEAGGAFTLALAPLLCTRKEDFKSVFGAEDGFVTWAQFVRPLQRLTNQKYLALRTEFLKLPPSELSDEQKQTQDLARNQKEQTPQVLSLGERAEQKVVRRTWLLGTKLGTGLNADNKPVGAVVGKVYPDTPAARANLAEGDVILAVNGRETLTDLVAFREIDHSNGKVVLKLRRGDEAPRDVDVTLQRVKPEEKRLNG